MHNPALSAGTIYDRVSSLRACTRSSTFLHGPFTVRVYVTRVARTFGTVYRPCVLFVLGMSARCRTRMVAFSCRYRLGIVPLLIKAVAAFHVWAPIHLQYYSAFAACDLFDLSMPASSLRTRSIASTAGRILVWDFSRIVAISEPSLLPLSSQLAI